MKEEPVPKKMPVRTRGWMKQKIMEEDTWTSSKNNKGEGTGTVNRVELWADNQGNFVWTLK